MYRRPFLKKIGLAGSALLASPFFSLGEILPRANKLKFITASDGHWGQPNTDFESSHRNLINAIHKEENVDFVVFNGDLIHDEPRFMPEVRDVYETLNYPYLVTRGNHDLISENDWLGLWGKATNFFMPVKENYGILLCDSSNEKGEYRCANLEYVKSVLEHNQSLSQVFVFIHISQNDWTRNGVACNPLLDLLASYPNVKATFHGHDHDVDGIMTYKKKPFFWSGHFGGSWGNPFPSYRVVEVGEDGNAKTFLKRVSDGVILNFHPI